MWINQKVTIIGIIENGQTFDILSIMLAVIGLIKQKCELIGLFNVLSLGAFHSTKFSKILVANQMERVNFRETFPKIWDNLLRLSQKVEIPKISEIACSI